MSDLSPDAGPDVGPDRKLWVNEVHPDQPDEPDTGQQGSPSAGSLPPGYDPATEITKILSGVPQDKWLLVMNAASEAAKNLVSASQPVTP